MIRTGAFILCTQYAALALRTPTWPTETHDDLESILYEQLGDFAVSFAGNIEGCKKDENPALPGQNEAAEWIRAGFHDMATADVAAGTGGLDASIAFELNRAENPGSVEFTNTLAISRSVFSSKTTISDALALTVLIASEVCSDGQVSWPYRVGRIDARGSGPSGVPEPQDDINKLEAAFKRTGFSKTEMIGLVACGHSVGGVNGVDFPTVVTVPENETTKFYFENFDSTDSSFDNRVATEFVSKTSKNPLAFGHNVTMRSDARIFNSDGMKEISRLAASNDAFHKTCSALMERMVNTVPRAVKLSDPILPIPVKPMNMFATVNDDNTITFNGTVRLIDQKAPNPGRSVKLFLRNRSGRACAQASARDSNNKPCRSVVAVEDPDSATYAAVSDPSRRPEFKRYNFVTTVPISEGLSGFDVQVTDKHQSGSTSVFHNNNGHGYPFGDAILLQRGLSCAEGPTTGFLNLTVAVLDSAKIKQLTGSLEVATKEDTNVPADRTTYVPRLARKPLTFKKVGAIKGSGYTLYNAQHTWDRLFFPKHYDLVGSNGQHTFQSLFNDATVLAECRSSP